MHRHYWIILIISLIAIRAAHAETITELAKATQNPIAVNPEANYFAFPFIDNLNGDYGNDNNTQNIINAKPVFPFRLTQEYDLILRPILTMYHQPTAGTGRGYVNGWGDINPTAFISPYSIHHYFVWGIGPSLFIPTATNTAFGTGKWSIGPQLALFYMPNKWVVGLLTSNVWSIAGDPSRAAVDQFSLQYFISYNLKNGWYITSQPTVTANWKATSDQWAIPFGGGVGRVIRLGAQSMNIAFEGYYNVANPGSSNSRWTAQLKIEFLYLAHRKE